MEHVKAVYCYPAYLGYMQSTSWEIPGWMNPKLKLRLPGEISTTSDMQMIHVQMWKLSYKEGWAPRIAAFELWCWRRLFESPLDNKEIKPVNPKGNQPWIFIERTDTEADAVIFWAPEAKNWLIRKDPDAGKDWRREEKGTTEDEMVGWHHQLNGHEFE